MSTAGKVLTVLILLVMLGWIVMMSAVTQLNVNWEEKIAAQQKTLDQATEDFTKARDDSYRITEQARSKQDETERELRLKLSKIAGAEARQSSYVEDLSRTKAEVADALSAVEVAKANLATREAEKIKNQENLAKLRDQIAQFKASNADLKSQLGQLQEDFKRLLAENAAKLDKAAKEGAARPASSVRESPSS
jgi:chromosome segregation ATPase